MNLENDIERIVWTEEQLSERVTELASQITLNFSKNNCPVIVGVATGAFLFLADLVRKIKLPISVDFVRVESYGSGTVSNGKPNISCDLKIDVTAKHVILGRAYITPSGLRSFSRPDVIGGCFVPGCESHDLSDTGTAVILKSPSNLGLVEDIVDTGNTLSCLIEHLKSKGASSISVCTLLDKPLRRKVNFELVGEGKFYRGFECPDYFVVGYGLDFAELYRNLPYVGVLKPEIYS